MINTMSICSYLSHYTANSKELLSKTPSHHTMSSMLCVEEHSTINACQHAIMHVGIVVTKALA